MVTVFHKAEFSTRNDNFFLSFDAYPPLICLQTKENSGPRGKFCLLETNQHAILNKLKSSKLLNALKVGDKSLINSQIGLLEVPAKLNFEGETSEVLLSSQVHFVMCLG